jgi:hypothetical protein
MVFHSVASCCHSLVRYFYDGIGVLKLHISLIRFKRIIEEGTFNDNVAIVMGGEIIKSQGDQINAGKTVSWRFTNVWLYKDKSWSIIAQAKIIKVE